jgi:hypothetical protein
MNKNNCFLSSGELCFRGNSDIYVFIKYVKARRVGHICMVFGPLNNDMIKPKYFGCFDRGFKKILT